MNWQERAGKGVFPPIPSYSSLFQPFQSIAINSNQFQPIPQSPISNPQSPIWNAQLFILSPIGHVCVSSLLETDCCFGQCRAMVLKIDQNKHFNKLIFIFVLINVVFFMNFLWTFFKVMPTTIKGPAYGKQQISQRQYKKAKSGVILLHPTHRVPPPLRNTLLTVDQLHSRTPYSLWTYPTAEHPTHLGPAPMLNPLLTLDLFHMEHPTHR